MVITAAASTNTSGHVPAALLGVILLALAALAWSGRWRSWAYSWALYSFITVIPTLGGLLVVYGLIPVAPGALVAILGLLLFVALLAAVVLFLWQPSWFGPRWLRTEVEARRRGYPPPRRAG